MRVHKHHRVSSWAQYDRRVRYSGRRLLGELDRFKNCILVAGCQRSGTTALSRLLTSSEGMVRFQFGHDDELDAALILSGWIDFPSTGRFCFQTTYLNNSYPEYFEHIDYRLIWVVRNPYSVVYSMLHNWKMAALNRLFRHCGHELLADGERWKYDRFGVWAVPRLRKACLSYNAKISQTGILKSRLDPDRIMILDYDDLIRNKRNILPELYNFTQLSYGEEYLSRLHSKSLSKADKFTSRETELIESTCMPLYLESRKYLTIDMTTA